MVHRQGAGEESDERWHRLQTSVKEQQKDLMDGEKEGYGKHAMQNNKNNEENEADSNTSVVV